MRKLTRYIPGRPVLILLGAVLLVVVLVMTRPRDIPEPAGEKSWAVETIAVELATVSPTLEIFGRVQSPQDSELSAAVEGVVTAMNVRDGNVVEAGAVLIELDRRDAELTLKQAEADLKEASAQLKFSKVRLSRSRQAAEKEQELLAINSSRSQRAAEIFKDGLLSKADLETANENLARQDLAVNQASLNVEENSAKVTELEARMARLAALRDRARLDLERTTVTAPFSGVISDMQVSEGDRVRPGDMLMRLQNPDSIEVRAQLPTRYARTVSQGLQEGASLNALIEVEDLSVTGRVTRVSGQTNEASGGVDCFVGFPPGVAGLRLGSTVRVLLEMPQEQNVVAVPGEAIYGRDLVYKVADGRMLPVSIERVGERAFADGRTEVLLRSTELVKGDRVVVTKLANAAKGLLVNTGEGQSAGSEPPPLTAEGN